MAAAAAPQWQKQHPGPRRARGRCGPPPSLSAPPATLLPACRAAQPPPLPASCRATASAPFPRPPGHRPPNLQWRPRSSSPSLRARLPRCTGAARSASRSTSSRYGPRTGACAADAAAGRPVACWGVGLLRQGAALPTVRTNLPQPPSPVPSADRARRARALSAAAAAPTSASRTRCAWGWRLGWRRRSPTWWRQVGLTRRGRAGAGRVPGPRRARGGVVARARAAWGDAPPCGAAAARRRWCVGEHAAAAAMAATPCGRFMAHGSAVTCSASASPGPLPQARSRPRSD